MLRNLFARPSIRVTGLTGVLAAVLGSAVAATPAHALQNIAPSSAAPIAVGTPFAGSEANGKPDVWRFDGPVAANDQLTFAIDNTAGSQRLDVCVIANVDDFGFDAEVSSACRDNDTNEVRVASGRAARLTVTYTRAPGPVLIRVASLYDRVNDYKVTLESVAPAAPPVVIPPAPVPAPQPAPAPVAPAPVPAPAPARDTVGPGIVFGARPRFVGSRLRASYSVQERGRERHRIYVNGMLAGRLDGSTGAGSFTVGFPVSKRVRGVVRRAKRRGRAVTVRWQIQVTDAAGNRSVRSKSFSVRP